MEMDRACWGIGVAVPCLHGKQRATEDLPETIEIGLDLPLAV
jgi:hypothetical protein